MVNRVGKDFQNYILHLRNAPAILYCCFFSYRLYSLRTVGYGRTRNNSQVTVAKIILAFLLAISILIQAFNFLFGYCKVIRLKEIETAWFLPQLLAAFLCFWLSLKEYRQRIEEKPYYQTLFFLLTYVSHFVGISLIKKLQIIQMLMIIIQLIFLTALVFMSICLKKKKKISSYLQVNQAKMEYQPPAEDQSLIDSIELGEQKPLGYPCLQTEVKVTIQGCVIKTLVKFDSVRKQQFKTLRSEENFSSLFSDLETEGKSRNLEHKNKEQVVALIAKDRELWTLNTLEFLGVPQKIGQNLMDKGEQRSEGIRIIDNYHPQKRKDFFQIPLLRVSQNAFQELILNGLESEQTLSTTLQELNQLSCVSDLSIQSSVLEAVNQLLQQKESCPLEVFHKLELLGSSNFPPAYASQRLQDQGFRVLKSVQVLSFQGSTYKIQVNLKSSQQQLQFLIEKDEKEIRDLHQKLLKERSGPVPSLPQKEGRSTQALESYLKTVLPQMNQAVLEFLGDFKYERESKDETDDPFQL